MSEGKKTGNEEIDESSYFSKKLVGSQCRKYRESIDTVFSILTDCSKYKEWWPKQWNFTVEKCTPETVGTKMQFTSGNGPYTTLITSIKKNEQMRVKYIDGIFRGTTDWNVSEIPEGTSVCFHSELVPWTKRIGLLSNFASEKTVRGYFLPLLDSLETKLQKQAEDKDELTRSNSLHSQISKATQSSTKHAK